MSVCVCIITDDRSSIKPSVIIIHHKLMSVCVCIITDDRSSLKPSVLIIHHKLMSVWVCVLSLMIEASSNLQFSLNDVIGLHAICVFIFLQLTPLVSEAGPFVPWLLTISQPNVLYLVPNGDELLEWAWQI